MKNVFALLFLSLNIVSQTVTRGPYLQQATPTSIIIKWQTSSTTNDLYAISIRNAIQGIHCIGR